MYGKMKSGKGKKSMSYGCDEKTLKKGFSGAKISDWTDQREYSQKEMSEKDFTKKPSKKG
jgi:hypothetical protein